MLQPKPHPLCSSPRLYWENKARWSPYRKKKKETHTFPLVAYEIVMNVNITVPKSLSLKLSFQINSEYERRTSTEVICSKPCFLLQPIAKKNISSTFSNSFDWGFSTGKQDKDISYLYALGRHMMLPMQGQTQIQLKSAEKVPAVWSGTGPPLDAS